MLTLGMRVINFYKNEQGKAPVEEFIDSLSAKQAQKLLWVMQLVEEMVRVPKQYFKKLIGTEDIWEIRAQVGSDIFRVLGFFVDNNTFIATNGFQKKAMHPPRTEISLAHKRKHAYLQNK
ncbi:MAG: type II toxin-antitoxin system RelE/ParE family toxin [Gammaproteobacteria bacterium]|jgi:phage-related protein